jgi:hypothetical protein
MEVVKIVTVEKKIEIPVEKIVYRDIIKEVPKITEVVKEI